MMPAVLLGPLRSLVLRHLQRFPPHSGLAGAACGRSWLRGAARQHRPEPLAPEPRRGE